MLLTREQARLVRIVIGMTAKDAAEAMGLRQATLLKYENGGPVQMRTVETIAKYYTETYRDSVRFGLSFAITALQDVLQIISRQEDEGEK